MYVIVEINGQQFKAEEGKKLFVHHQHGQPHKDVAHRFHIAVFFHFAEADDSARNGAQPDKAEQSPAP